MPATPPRTVERWVLQPLLDAGLPLEEIKDLLFRVAFAGIVGDDVPRACREVVAGRSGRVRAAWLETMHRLLGSAEGRLPCPDEPPGSRPAAGSQPESPGRPRRL